MKNTILLKLFAILLVFASCSKQNIEEEKITMLPPGIDGDWKVTKITGGFAGVNLNFEGSVLYNFNTTTNQLTVNNNYIGTNPVKGLPTGNYPFSLSGTNSININSPGLHLLNILHKILRIHIVILG